LISNSMILIIKASEHESFIEMPVYLVTEIGMQLLSLGSFEPNIDYLKAVGAHFKSQGCSVKLASYERTPTEILYLDVQDL